MEMGSLVKKDEALRTGLVPAPFQTSFQSTAAICKYLGVREEAGIHQRPHSVRDLSGLPWTYGDFPCSLVFQGLGP